VYIDNYNILYVIYNKNFKRQNTVWEKKKKIKAYTQSFQFINFKIRDMCLKPSDGFLLVF